MTKDKIKNYLQGVYGVDFFSKIVTVFVPTLSSTNLRFKNRVIEIITMILIVYFEILRVFSVNRYQRMIENQKFAKAVKPMMDSFEKYKIRAANSKDKKYIKCPNYRKEMKIPRSKGKIKVTCSHCGHRLVKKS